MTLPIMASVVEALAVTIMIGIFSVASSLLIFLQTSSPVILGSIRSRMIRWGLSWLAFLKPSSPSLAIETSYLPVCSRFSFTNAARCSSSSIMRILLFRFIAPSDNPTVKSPYTYSLPSAWRSLKVRGVLFLSAAGSRMLFDRIYI